MYELLFATILILATIFEYDFDDKKNSLSMKQFQINLNGVFSIFNEKEKDDVFYMIFLEMMNLCIMTRGMNEQIKKIEQIQEQDKKVVLEISDVMEKVNNGFSDKELYGGVV